MRLEELRRKLEKAMTWMEKAMLVSAKYDAYLSVGVAVLVLLWPHNAHATQPTVTLQSVYTSARAGIKGLWGALFTIAACGGGLLEYFSNGKHMGHLMTFAGVAFSPHLCCALVDFFFNTGDTGTQQ